MKMMPLYDKVLVEGYEFDNKSTILLPETASKKMITAKVVAVGNGYIGGDGNIHRLNVEVGDIVIFPSFTSVIEYPFEGKKYLIVSERDLLGRIG